MNRLVLSYAFLLFVGGILGYVMAQSMPSLVMGSLFASIFLFLSFQKSAWSARLTVALTGLLTAFFVYRFILTQKLMPAGLMSIISLLLFMWLARDCFSNACCKSDTDKEPK
ncbi:MAG: TMEM14 family protein [Parachlamydiaceae bacterium]